MNRQRDRAERGISYLERRRELTPSCKPQRRPTHNCLYGQGVQCKKPKPQATRSDNHEPLSYKREVNSKDKGKGKDAARRMGLKFAV
jgi:hypothetical protein